MSVLRAKCPTCRTLTAVALGPEYECHSCGRTFGAGLVRVPRAWGEGGEAMAEAASLPLDYPETAVIEEDTLHAQTLALASDLPVRPLVLGGCCCSHVGAVEALASRHDRLGIVWFDAHGDLNTPETSPSGNAWGMPLRMLIDGGAVHAEDVALVGARNLDPPEVEFIDRAGIHDSADAVLDRVDCVYVALDCDVFEPSELAVFMPEPGGPTLARVERQLGSIRASGSVVGAGFTGLAPDPLNVEKLERLAAAPVERRLSDHHRVREPRRELRLGEALGVRAEIEERERVLRVQVGRLLGERALVRERRDPRPCAHREMVAALRADPQRRVELVVPVVGVPARTGVRMLRRRRRLVAGLDRDVDFGHGRTA